MDIPLFSSGNGPGGTSVVAPPPTSSPVHHGVHHTSRKTIFDRSPSSASPPMTTTPNSLMASLRSTASSVGQIGGRSCLDTSAPADNETGSNASSPPPPSTGPLSAPPTSIGGPLSITDFKTEITGPGEYLTTGGTTTGSGGSPISPATATDETAQFEADKRTIYK